MPQGTKIVIESINELLNQIIAVAGKEEEDDGCHTKIDPDVALSAFLFKGNIDPEHIRGYCDKLDDYSILVESEYYNLILEGADPPKHPVDRTIIAIDNVEIHSSEAWMNQTKLINHVFDILNADVVAYLSPEDSDPLELVLTRSGEYEDFAQTGILVKFR